MLTHRWPGPSDWSWRVRERQTALRRFALAVIISACAWAVLIALVAG